MTVDEIIALTAEKVVAISVYHGVTTWAFQGAGGPFHERPTKPPPQAQPVLAGGYKGAESGVWGNTHERASDTTLLLQEERLIPWGDVV